MSTPNPLAARPSRRAILAGAFAATGAVLTGCGTGGSSSSSGGSGGTTLRVSTWGNDSRTKLTQQAIDAYTKANSGVTVKLENTEWGSYWDKLATSAAAGNAPDLIQMDESQIAAYGSRGSLLDLETVKGDLDLSAMDAKILDTGRVGGKLVGAPVGIGIFSVGVNPTLLEKAGVSMPDDKVWTWDQFAEAASAVTAKLGTQGVYGFDMFGAAAAELGAWARQHGQEVWPTTGQSVTAETIKSFFEYAVKLIAMKATPAASAQTENTTAALDASLFATNKAAFHLQFHTQIQAYGAASRNVLQLRRLPGITPGKAQMVNKASMYWSVSAKSQNAAAAAKLARFLLTDPAATKLLTTERGIPAIPSVQKEIEPLLSPQSKVALAFSQDVAGELVSPPQVTPAKSAGFGSQFTPIADDVLFGRTSPADGATKVMAIINSMK